MKKIPSYTLLELIVVLAISGIVMLNIIGLYLYVQKQFYNYKDQIDYEIELVQFISTLTNDINFGNKIKSGQNEIIIEKNNSKDVLYNFRKEKILRTDERTDTFNVSIRKIKTFSIDDYKLINRISLDVIRGTKVSSFNFIKNYDNATIVNMEIKQGEHGN